MSLRKTDLKPSKHKKTRKPLPVQYRTVEFLKLQNKWYNKLRLDGFRDIEFFDNTGEPTVNMLRDPVYNLIKQYSPQTAYYFNKAGWFLHHGWFRSRIHQTVWELHCQGLSIRQTCAKLKCTYSWAQQCLVKIRREMMKNTLYESIEAKKITNDARRFEYLVSKAIDKKG